MADNLGFVDPTVTVVKEQVPLAARLTDLSGRTIGLLDNSKEQADNILAAIGRALRERYGVKEVMTRRAAHYSTPASEEIVEEMAGACDAVVCALGG